MAALSLFISYAHKDEALRQQLEKHLAQLQREGLITDWHAGKVLPGEMREEEIDKHLQTASIILLLLSPDLLASDHYEKEMQYALKRHERDESYVVPIILRHCGWQHTLLKHLHYLPRDGKPLTRWPDQDEAFETVTRDLRNYIEKQKPPAPPLSLSEQQNRMRLLRRVREIWINGLLKQSFLDTARIDLCLQDRPDVIVNLMRQQVQDLKQTPEILPAGTPILRTYDRGDGELLILGEPGAGKTILLLELTRTLLERAEHMERLRIPVVFNLSSWAEMQQSLGAWMVEELLTKYQVPRKIGQHWIDEDRILPLLDGLDEVAKKARASCVQEINNYYQQQLDKHEECPIVICCRREEYETLTTHVNIQNAISILPLTDTQVDTYLEEGGEQMKVLRQALKKDIGLRELAHQPLMLNVFVLAYRGAKSAEVPKGKTPEEMRYTIFARYVERMLKHRETLRGWEPMQMIYWLAFLAKQMQQHDQTVFSLENLQSTWLPSRSSKSLYRSAVALLFAQISALAGQLMLGLAGGMVFGWIYISAVAWGFWLVGLLIGKRDTKIEPAEALTWSWKKARLPMLLGALSGGLGGVLGAGLLTWLFFGLAAVQTAVLISGLTGLPAGGLLAALMKGLSRGQLSDDLSLSPNKRIWRSGKNGLIVGLIFGLVSGLCSVIYSWLSSGTDFSSWVIFLVLIGAIGSGLCNGLAMGLYFGLNAFVRHFILRFALSAGGNLPLKLIPFLDEAARRLLLRKVGGSYIFVHRLLLDYFAKLDDPGFAKRYLLLERRHRKEKNYRVKASKAAVYHKNRNNR